MNEQKAEQTEQQQTRTPPDAELTAIKRIRGILGELPPLARQRVLAYVADRANEERFSGPHFGAALATPSEWAQERLLEAPLASVAGKL